jgi:hypothetical protein
MLIGDVNCFVLTYCFFPTISHQTSQPNEQCAFKLHKLPKVVAQEHPNWWWPFKFSWLPELPGHLMLPSKV